MNTFYCTVTRYLPPIPLPPRSLIIERYPPAPEKPRKRIIRMFASVTDCCFFAIQATL